MSLKNCDKIFDFLLTKQVTQEVLKKIVLKATMSRCEENHIAPLVILHPVIWIWMQPAALCELGSSWGR